MSNTVAVTNTMSAPAMTAIEFDNHLKTIVSSGKKFVQDVQVAGMYAMNQALAHDNYDAFFKVYRAIREGVNLRSANQFRLWATQFAPVKFITENEQVVKARKSKGESAAVLNIIGASETQWNTVEGFTDDESRKAIEQLFTADKLIDRLDRAISALQKAVEKGEYASETDKLALPVMLEKVQSFKQEIEQDLSQLTPATLAA